MVPRCNTTQGRPHVCPFLSLIVPHALLDLLYLINPTTMKRLITLFFALLFTATLFAGEEEVTLNTPTGDIYGVLLTPDSDTRCPLVIIIAGSGPTDHNGNTIGSDYRNNSLKMLAE